VTSPATSGAGEKRSRHGRDRSGGAADAAGRALRPSAGHARPGRPQGPGLRAPVLLLRPGAVCRAQVDGQDRRNPDRGHRRGDGGRVPRSERRPGSQTLVLDHYLEICRASPAPCRGRSPRTRRGRRASSPRPMRRSGRGRAGSSGRRRDAGPHRGPAPPSGPAVPGVHAALEAVNSAARPTRTSWPSRPAGSPKGADPPARRCLGGHLRRFDRDVPVLTVYDGLLAGSVR